MIVKEEAKKILESLPDTSDWNDITYRFYVQQKIAYALSEAEKGNVLSHEEVKKQFLSK